MNLRSNKGYTGIDISISMILILIFIPTIFGSIYNIQRYSNGVKREATALNMATDILEIAKATEYDKLNLENEENESFVEKMSQKYTKDVNDNSKYSKETDNVYYKIDVDLSNYYPENIEEEKDLIKKINVVVTYMVGNRKRNVEIGTALKTPYI